MLCKSVGLPFQAFSVADFMWSPGWVKTKGRPKTAERMI